MGGEPLPGQKKNRRDSGPLCRGRRSCSEATGSPEPDESSNRQEADEEPGRSDKEAVGEWLWHPPALLSAGAAET
jgi:hypothetical protein